jgi:uncharacterized DUF497 family protein
VSLLFVDKKRWLWYTLSMELKIIFIPSAFKHGVSAENIRWALSHYLADGTIEEADENRYVAIGFDKSGNLLEIMYNHIDGQTVKVFHAMKCRKQFREKLGIGEKEWQT